MLGTLAASAALFLVLFEFLAYQLRSGNDPAIGSGQIAAQVAPAAGHGTAPAAASGTPLVTSTSGSVPAPAATAQGTTPVSAGQSSGAGHSIRTRTSGGLPGARRGGERDDGGFLS